MAIGQVSSPSIPFRLAQAYGVARSAPVPPVSAASGTAPIGRIEPATPTVTQTSAARSVSIDRLVGGIVPGKIDFSGTAPTQRDDALPFYRRPGEANEAATAIRVGRALDIEG